MYAVIRTGGKQYKVEPGKELKIEKIEAEKGQQVSFDEVLLLSNDSGVEIGQPLVSGAVVKASVVDEVKDSKKIIYKKIRRHGKRLKKGHRQVLSIIKVEGIEKNGS